MSDAKPSFTSDWLTKQLWQFERYLKPLAGKPCRLLEIGCYEGRTTCWLLQNLVTHPDASLLAIDIYEQPLFTSNMKLQPNAGQMTLMVGPSRDVLRHVGPPASFDFVYIDGGHGTVDVIEDAVLAFRLCKVGGVIGFDDYKWNDKTSKEEGRPKPAIDAFLDLYGRKLKLLNKDYQAWVTKTSD